MWCVLLINAYGALPPEVCLGLFPDGPLTLSCPLESLWKGLLKEQVDLFNYDGHISPFGAF